MIEKHNYIILSPLSQIGEKYMIHKWYHLMLFVLYAKCPQKSPHHWYEYQN